jgi:hypothetical protein
MDPFIGGNYDSRLLPVYMPDADPETKRPMAYLAWILGGVIYLRVPLGDENEGLKKLRDEATAIGCPGGPLIPAIRYSPHDGKRFITFYCLLWGGEAVESDRVEWHLSAETHAEWDACAEEQGWPAQCTGKLRVVDYTS